MKTYLKSQDENLLKDSGYQGIKFQKKIDFEKLYNQRIN